MPRALRTLRLSFRETHLTHFGGMVLLQRFCNKLGLRRLLQQSLRISQRNADYHPCDLVLALLYVIMAGPSLCRGRRRRKPERRDGRHLD